MPFALPKVIAAGTAVRLHAVKHPEDLMSEMNKLVKLGIVLLAAVLMPACALSPQTIQISPDLIPDGIKPVSGVTLALDVHDGRQNRVVGYRGGVYTTASITTRENVADAIRAEVSRVLTGLGVSIVAKGAPADISLDLDLQQLTYTAKQEKILWKASVVAVINARVSVGSKSVSNNFEDQLSREFATTPSMFDNAKLINDVVSKLLQRVIEDESLTKPLSARRS